MKKDFTIFSIDDSEMSRSLLEMGLGWSYQIESFESGEACLQRLAAAAPDMFLLDVNMHGMNGYELCRRIRGLPGGRKTPIVFISGRDDVQSRLDAYEAGGDDFIIKPFELKELELKIAAICRLISDKSDLQEKFVESETLSTHVLSNLEEHIELNKFLHALNTCGNYRELAEAMLNMIRGFNLEGALQFRLPEFEITLNHDGDVCPLEASIIHQVHSSDTVVRFKSRAAYNYDHVSILISNMPITDANLCDRMREHMSVILEMANTKLDTMLLREEKIQARDEISQLVGELAKTMASLKRKYASARHQGDKATGAMLSQLAARLAPAAMIQSHEEAILDGVKDSASGLIELFDFGEETEQEITKITDRMKAFLK